MLRRDVHAALTSFASSACVAVCGGVVLGQTALAQTHTTNIHLGDCRRVNYDYLGQEANNHSYWPNISEDGTFMTFVSAAKLVALDQNTSLDVFYLDLVNGTPPELVSVALNGAAGDYTSWFEAHASADGRFVAFCSSADDLVAGDTNADTDAFVRDRQLGVTYLCSVSSAGVQGSAKYTIGMSDDARFVAFSSSSSLLVLQDTNAFPDVFVRDRLLNTTERVSVDSHGVQGNRGSGGLDPICVSGDGRYVVFTSDATNLVPNDSNGAPDVFVHDRIAHSTQLVSVGVSGQLGNMGGSFARASKDCRIIAFESLSSNLVPNDTNSANDIFVRDLDAATTQRVSVSSLGGQGNGDSLKHKVSSDGRFISFTSIATNLVPSDTNGTWDGFVFDRLTRQTTRYNIGVNGAEPNGDAAAASFSKNGHVIAFAGSASNLVPADTNGFVDIFTRRWDTPSTYCTSKVNSLGCLPAISRSGTASISSTQPCLIQAEHVLNQKVGLLLYSTRGFAALAFHGGVLCMLPPLHRTPQQSSGGSLSGADCTGAFSFDFNDWLSLGIDPTLVSGQQVWAQYWSRDPGFPPPGNASLTNALVFEVGP